MATIDTLLVRLEADTERMRRELARADTVVAGTAEKIERSVTRVQRSFDGLDRAAATAGGGMNRFTFIAQQVGFQIGDVATQISMGTNAMRAFTVQGSQLISMLGGPWGAAAGAALAIGGALASTLFDTADASDGATKATYSYAKALETAREIAKQVDDLGKSQAQRLRERRDETLKAAEAEIASAQAALEAARIRARAEAGAFNVGAEEAGVPELDADVRRLTALLDQRRRELENLRREFAKIEPKLSQDEARQSREKAARESERFFDMLDRLEGNLTRKVEQENKRRADFVADIEEALAKRAEQRVEREIRANEKAAESAIRAAERMARETQRRVEVATDRIVDFGADAFFDRLTGRAGSFWESFKEFGLRTFAQLAAEAVIRPIVVPILQGALGGSSGGALGGSSGGVLGSLGSSIGQTLFSQGVSQALGLTGVGAGLGASLFGVSGGSAAAVAAAHAAGVAAVPGGVATAGTSGLLGSGGSFLGLGAAGGPIAMAAIAGLALAAGSGMFNKESRRGPTSGAGLFVDAAGNLRFQFSADNGGDPMAMRAEAERALALINQISQATGRTITQEDLRRAQLAISPSGSVQVGMGTISAIGIGQFARGGFRGADDLVRDLLRGGLFGDPNDPRVRTILEQGVEGFSQAKAISDGIGRAILAITDPFEAAMANLEDEHKARLEAVRAIGGDIVDAERLFQLQRQQVIDQFREQEMAKLESARAQIVNFFSSLLDPLTSFRASLNVGPQSALSPGAQLDFARREFDQLFALAQSGNRAAIEAFPQVAQQFLGASRAVNATGPGFAADFALTNTRLNQVIGQVQALQDANFANLAATFELSIQDQTAQLRKEFQALTAAVNRLKAAA